jgi:hypothetical protein
MPMSLRAAGSAAAFARTAAAVRRRTEDRLRELYGQLPDPLSGQFHRVLTPYLEKFVLRDPPRNIVMAIAYDLGIRDTAELVLLSTSTALGGMHSLVLDDLVDNRGASGRPWHDIYLAHLLYVLHQDLLQQVHAADWSERGRPATLAAQVETYAALVEEEILHVGQPTPYVDSSLVWGKCAPVKGVIERVLARAGRRELKPDFDLAADCACFALCTLDDMLDWPEDYDRRRFTYPVQRALDRIEADWCPERHEEMRGLIEHELVFGTTHHALMAEITEALKEARRLVGKVSPTLDLMLAGSVEGAMLSWRRHLRYLEHVELKLVESQGPVA